MLEDRIKALPYCTEKISSKIENTIGPIWQYWSQGYEQAPPIVKNAIHYNKNNLSGRKYIFLDDSNIHKYVDIPIHIIQKINTIGNTHFSDFLRLFLLKKYGGTWIDATVMLTAPIPETIIESNFFVFTRNCDPFILSNWFIHSKKITL